MIRCPVNTRHAELNITACCCGFRFSPARTLVDLVPQDDPRTGNIVDPGHPLLCAMRVAAWRVEDELRKATARNQARSRVNRRVEYLDRRPAWYLGDRDYIDTWTGRTYERDALLAAWGR